MTNHWVGHLLIKSTDVDEFFNIRVIIHELEYSLNGDYAINTSVETEGETESSIVAKLVQKYDITVDEVGIEIEVTVVTEK